MSFDIFVQDIRKDVKSIGTDAPVETFAFHLRGDETGLFALDGDLRHAYMRWRAYRDRVCAPPR